MVWQARRKQTVNPSGYLSMCLEGNTSNVNNTQTYHFYAKYNEQSRSTHSPDNKKLMEAVSSVICSIYEPHFFTGPGLEKRTKANLSSATELSHRPRFNTGIKGLSGSGNAYVGLAWFTRSTAGITEKLIWDNGQFNGYDGFIGFTPRGVVILCNGVQSLHLSQIGFGPYDNL